MVRRGNNSINFIFFSAHGQARMFPLIPRHFQAKKKIIYILIFFINLLTRSTMANEVVSMLDEALYWKRPDGKIRYQRSSLQYINHFLKKVRCYHPSCNKFVQYVPELKAVTCDSGHHRGPNELKRYWEPLLKGLQYNSLFSFRNKVDWESEEEDDEVTNWLNSQEPESEPESEMEVEENVDPDSDDIVSWLKCRYCLEFNGLTLSQVQRINTQHNITCTCCLAKI